MALEEIVIDPPKVGMSVDDSGLCPIVVDIDGEIGFRRRTALLKPLKRGGVATCVERKNRCGPQLVLAPIHAATRCRTHFLDVALGSSSSADRRLVHDFVYFHEHPTIMGVEKIRDGVTHG